MMEIVVFVFALSVDSFLAAFAYGNKDIYIPIPSALLISGIGVGILKFSISLADWINNYLTYEGCRMIAFGIFFFMGISSLFQGSIKQYLRRHQRKAITLSFHNLRFVLDIYLDETKADVDKSKYLSLKEASFLALALSLDGLASGFAFGMQMVEEELVLVIGFCVGFVSILAGYRVGKALGAIQKYDFSWLSSILFLLLAFMRFL